LTAGGQYNRVRFLDFNAYTQPCYSFQREMAAAGVTVDKRMIQSSAALTLNLEGAENVVYFTHHYTNMAIDKNLFLLGTAASAKELGINKVTAVCPIEHDFAYTEDEKSWVQERQEAEQRALQINGNMTIMNTDLVYSDKSSHTLHYLAQLVAKGSALPKAFLSEDAKFKPVACEDLANSVMHSMNSNMTGQFAVRGASEHSIKEIVGLIEEASGKSAGSSKASNVLMDLLCLLFAEFAHGQTITKNMEHMVKHFAKNVDECPVPGDCFWGATASKPTGASISESYKTNGVDAQSLSEPSLGDYCCPQLN